jgi:hypothetical protein
MVVASSAPVPLAIVTQENIHAEVLFKPQFKFVYPTGVVLPRSQ